VGDKKVGGFSVCSTKSRELRGGGGGGRGRGELVPFKIKWEHSSNNQHKWPLGLTYDPVARDSALTPQEGLNWPLS
jgi:hypothetical protein